MFRDVTSVLEDHEAFNQCIELMAEHYKSFKFDKIAGTEARGFLFGAPLALSMGIGFIPVRKPGKLPAQQSLKHMNLNMVLIILRSTKMP